MATKQEREALHKKLTDVETEREEKHADLDTKRTAYHEALVAAQEVSDRENGIEDEYEAMIVTDEPPARPAE